MSQHRAPIKEALSLQGPAGVLEALLEVPHVDAIRAAAVVCHPHPLHQGTMLNKVVHTLCRALNELGLPTVRFNFRGVGASDGTYAEGAGESEDTVAVCDWVRQRYAGAELWLAGFSFGAMVTCRAAVIARPARLISIAPPADRTRQLLAGHRPVGTWLVIQGDADAVVSADAVADWVKEFSPPPQLILLPGVDHFFHGHLTLLRDTLFDHLPVPAGKP